MKPLEPNDDEKLTDLFECLREDEAQIEAPAHVRSAVMAAWDAQRDSYVVSGFSRTDNNKTVFWRSAAAMAAGVVLAVTLARLGRELQVGIPPAAAPQAPSATLHLVGGPIAEGEAVRVVRVSMAPAMLASLGVRSTAGDLVESVDVDVIVGEDGVARAIRVGM